MSDTQRPLAEVQRIMKHAKLEKEDHKSCVQCLQFVDEMDSDAFKLIEVSPEIIDCLQEGDKVIIRGDKADSAVLCTENHTYDMKEQETSNLLLLVPGLKSSDQLPPGKDLFVVDTDIATVHHKYFELRRMKPRLKKLQHLLEENMFSGQECENDEEHQGNKYTYDDLLNLVQASENEIKEGLHQLQACKIHEYWRLLDFDFRGTVLDHILRLLDEESWTFEDVPVKKCCDILQDLYPRHVVKQILLNFSERFEESEESSEGKCRLSEDKICRFFAEMILKPTESFNFTEFEKVWQQSVPDGLKTGLYQLEGMALIDRESTPQVIRYFPASNLPEDVNDRFQVLFKTKEKWTAEEIMPYINDLATEKVKPSALLTKYARASTQKGIKVYNSKKPVS